MGTMYQTIYYTHDDDSDHDDDGDDDRADDDADGNDDGDDGYKIINQHCINFGPSSIRQNKPLLWCTHGVFFSVPGCSRAGSERFSAFLVEIILKRTLSASWESI